MKIFGLKIKSKHSVYITLALLLIVVVFIQTSGVSILESIPYLPIESWANTFIDWLNTNLNLLFTAIAGIITGLLSPIQYTLFNLNPLVVAILLTFLGYKTGGKKLAIFIFLALALIASMGYWEATMITLSLVIVSTLLAIIVGVPLGIWKAHSRALAGVLDPILDFMQTMPLFVYLIPAVLFFSIGNVPGIVATFIFATPPAVRLTSLGIEQIPANVIEAGRAFGASPWQFLTKVEIPFAMPSIMMGINQAIMLSLSMVVVASMIGAEGLGQEVLRGITRLNVGQGIASGIGIVLLAMILDRMSKTIWKKNR